MFSLPELPLWWQVQSSEKVVQPTQVVQEMAQAKVGTLEHLWCCFIVGELTVPDLLQVLFLLFGVF
jgi:hypothetical protein